MNERDIFYAIAVVLLIVMLLFFTAIAYDLPGPPQIGPR